MRCCHSCKVRHGKGEERWELPFSSMLRHLKQDKAMCQEHPAGSSPGQAACLQTKPSPPLTSLTAHTAQPNFSQNAQRPGSKSARSLVPQPPDMGSPGLKPEAPALPQVSDTFLPFFESSQRYTPMYVHQSDASPRPKQHFIKN